MKLLLLAVSVLFFSCATVKMNLALQTTTQEAPIEIAKKVLLENDYSLTNKTPEIIETEFKMDNWALGQYRWKVIINIIDNTNFKANIHTELKLASETTWTITETLREDIANKILDPLKESFSKYGVKIKTMDDIQ